MQKENSINDLIEILSRYGYDMLVNNNLITILYDGFVKTMPLDNVLNMIHSDVYSIPIDDVALVLISLHEGAKDISRGKYDNMPPITKEESNNQLRKLLKNVRKNNS